VRDRAGFYQGQIAAAPWNKEDQFRVPVAYRNEESFQLSGAIPDYIAYHSDLPAWLISHPLKAGGHTALDPPFAYGFLEIHGDHIGIPGYSAKRQSLRYFSAVALYSALQGNFIINPCCHQRSAANVLPVKSRMRQRYTQRETDCQKY
jgi:hypothetical protein